MRTNYKTLVRPFVVAGAVFLGGGGIVWAQDAPGSPAVGEKRFDAARATWHEALTLLAELDGVVAKRQLKQVHDISLNLRDTVREIRFGWGPLEPASREKAEGVIRRLDGLLDRLHESADHNDIRATVKGQRQVHVLLDELATVFPEGTLKAPGPVVARGPVKDPYCRMTVDPATAAAKVNLNGQMYYFCAASEAEAFKKAPTAYVQLYDDLSFGTPPKFQLSVFTPQSPAPGQPASIVFGIKDEKGAPVRQFQEVHEKLFHLILVSEDLSWFGHVHPWQGPDGRFYLRHTFPRPGKYILFSDFTPASGSNTVVRSELVVAGNTSQHRNALAVDTSLKREVAGYEVRLKPSGPLVAGKQVALTYTLEKGGHPVENMTPYLAAMGHLMAISSDTRQAVHTHTVSPGTDPETGYEVTSSMATAKGPSQTFKLEFPTAGAYKIWAQFGVGGEIITVPFTVRVQESKTMNKPMHKAALATAIAAPLLTGAPARAKPAAAPSAAQKVTVVLPQGYREGTATVKAGKPVAVTFWLKSDAGCGNTIALPAAKWKKDLKVGEKATVTYTPTKTGKLTYECGMGHMKGSLVVK